MCLTESEKRLVAEIGFEEDIYDLLRQDAGRAWDRLEGLSDQHESHAVNGLSLSVAQGEVEPFFERVQPVLLSRGYRAFWSELHEPNGLKRSDEIAVVKGDDDFQMIRLRRSDGANYGVATEDILLKLAEWRNRCDFEVSGASRAWVFLRFTTLPENVCRFAEEVYEFCPDTVEQGVGLNSEQDEPETFEAARLLCPEISEQMQRKLAEDKAKQQAMPLPPGAAELLSQLESGAFGFNTSTEMGIRLLALDIKESRNLFLWWD